MSGPRGGVYRGPTGVEYGSRLYISRTVIYTRPPCRLHVSLDHGPI